MRSLRFRGSILECYFLLLGVGLSFRLELGAQFRGVVLKMIFFSFFGIPVVGSLLPCLRISCRLRF